MVRNITTRQYHAHRYTHDDMLYTYSTQNNQNSPSARGGPPPGSVEPWSWGGGTGAVEPVFTWGGGTGAVEPVKTWGGGTGAVEPVVMNTGIPHAYDTSTRFDDTRESSYDSNA